MEVLYIQKFDRHLTLVWMESYTFSKLKVSKSLTFLHRFSRDYQTLGEVRPVYSSYSFCLFPLLLRLFGLFIHNSLKSYMFRVTFHYTPYVSSILVPEVSRNNPPSDWVYIFIFVINRLILHTYTVPSPLIFTINPWVSFLYVVDRNLVVFLYVSYRKVNVEVLL